VENKERLQIALVLKARQSRKVNRKPPLNRHIPPSPKELYQEVEAQAELSYDQLQGEWHEWLEVARRYDRKVPSQDRADIRHDIIVELHRARQRDDKPLPLLRAYRIASLMVALYWRERIKREVKVCVYSGLPAEPHCKTCQRYVRDCPYLAIRPVESLDQPTSDYEGYECRLLDTVADDKAMDFDQCLDDKAWLLGCPTRLIEIGYKLKRGIPLDNKDDCYLRRYRRREQKRLF